MVGSKIPIRPPGLRLGSLGLFIASFIPQTGTSSVIKCFIFVKLYLYPSVLINYINLKPFQANPVDPRLAAPLTAPLTGPEWFAAPVLEVSRLAVGAASHRPPGGT